MLDKIPSVESIGVAVMGVVEEETVTEGEAEVNVFNLSLDKSY